MLHEDYGHYSYTEHYSLGDIFIYTSADEEKGVLLELKGRGCRQFESYLLAQERSWYDFLMDALVDGGVMKRIDLAINDHMGILDIPELAEKCRKREYIGKSRSYKFYLSGAVSYTHLDIEDDGQTVLITERIIKIHTTATDKDGNKELEAGKEVTIVDTVTLEGLEVGTQYKLVGWQMLKEENAELLINGKHVESDYTFTADSETMKVEVTFTFDATSLDGKQLVTFEELYDLSNPDEPKKVTEHKDIEDEGQTITFKEKPEVPEEPEKPEIPQTPDTPHKTNSPKTGDSTNLYGLLALLMTSGAGLAGIFFYKRRKMKKS